MSAAPQPIAAFGDTVTLVIVLLALRYALLAWRPERWARVVALWLRRIAIVTLLLFILRLASIAVERPDVAKPVIAFVIAFVSGGIAVLMLDRLITRAIVGRRRNRI